MLGEWVCKAVLTCNIIQGHAIVLCCFHDAAFVLNGGMGCRRLTSLHLHTGKSIPFLWRQNWAYSSDRRSFLSPFVGFHICLEAHAVLLNQGSSFLLFRKVCCLCCCHKIVGICLEMYWQYVSTAVGPKTSQQASSTAWLCKKSSATLVDRVVVVIPTCSIYLILNMCFQSVNSLSSFVRSPW